MIERKRKTIKFILRLLTILLNGFLLFFFNQPNFVWPAIALFLFIPTKKPLARLWYMQEVYNIRLTAYFSVSFNLLAPFTIKKRIQAIIKKLSTTLRKLP